MERPATFLSVAARNRQREFRQPLLSDDQFLLPSIREAFPPRKNAMLLHHWIHCQRGEYQAEQSSLRDRTSKDQLWFVSIVTICFEKQILKNIFRVIKLHASPCHRRRHDNINNITPATPKPRLRHRSRESP